MIKLFSYFICITVYLLTNSVAAAELKVRKGYAYDIKTQELVYIEVHNETWEDNVLLKDDVEYLLPDGSLLASKSVDYSISALIPDFKLNNHVSGHQEMANKVADEYEIKFIKMTGKKAKADRIKLPENGVSDAGFDRLIERDWDKLIAGEVIKKDFLVPSLMRFITFKIYQDKITKSDNGKYRTIIVEPNNLLVRIAAGSLILDYDYELPNLRKFEGISNMRDQEGDNYQVSIIFPEDETRLAELETVNKE